VFYFCLHYLPYLAIEKDKDTNNILKRKPTTISRHINCKMVVVLVIVVAIIAEKIETKAGSYRPQASDHRELLGDFHLAGECCGPSVLRRGTDLECMHLYQPITTTKQVHHCV